MVKKKATKRQIKRRSAKKVVRKRATKKLVRKPAAKKTVRKSVPKEKSPAKRKAVPKKKAASKRRVARPKRQGARATAKKPVKRASRKPAKKRTTKRQGRKAPARAAKQRARKAVKRALPRLPQAPRKGKGTPALLEVFTSSAVMARMLRALFREPGASFSLKDLAARTGSPLPHVRREAERLAAMGIAETLKKGKNPRIRVSSTFPFLEEVRVLATRSAPVSHGDLVDMLRGFGRPRLIAISGVFTNNPKAQTDILIVADRLSEKRLAKAIAEVEAAVASEVRWTGMETKEFQYRWKMFDRFLRDFLTQPHERVVEKLILK